MKFRMLRRSVVGAGLFVIMSSLMASLVPAFSQDESRAERIIARGKVFATANCARCHAIDASGKSTHPDAPPFRDILKRYPIDALVEGYTDTIYSDHPDMPEFKVNPDELEAILWYLESLQER